MTEQEREERKEAGKQADAALAEAQRLVGRGRRISRAWVSSRQENNFRAMIRRLGQRTIEDGT